MPDVLRNLLAFVAGAAAAVTLVAVGDAVVGRIWPLPPGLDLRDTEEIARAVGALPAAAHLALAAGWAIATGAGALVATRLAAGRRPWPGLAVTALLLAATAANLALVGHSIWMWAVALPAVAAAGWVGSGGVGRSLTPAPAAGR